MTRRTLLGLVVLACLFVPAGRADAPSTLTDGDTATVARWFDAARGKPRLVVLLSPT